MGFFRVAVLATFAFSCQSGFTTNESTADKWAQTLLRTELASLEGGLQDLHARGRLSNAGLVKSLRVSRDLKDLLRTPTPENLSSAGLHYLILTDVLAVNQLTALVADGDNAPEALAQAKTGSDRLLQEFSASSDAETVKRDLKEVEIAAEKARTLLIVSKRKQAIQGAALRLQALTHFDPASRELNDEALRLFKIALEHYDDGKSEEAEGILSNALAHAFGGLSQRWDGRHLWHFFQLRLLVLGIQSDSQIASTDKTRLTQRLAALREAADGATYEKISAELVALCSQIAPPNAHESLWSLYLQPEAVQNLAARKLRAIREWLPQAQDSFKKNQTYIQSWQTGYNQNIQTSMDQMAEKLAKASHSLRENIEWKVLEAFHGSLPFFQTITMYTLEAMLDRSSAAPEYYGIWERSLVRLAQGKRILDRADEKKLHDCLRTERREGVQRAWLNRHNANVAALSVLLATEAIAIPFTGGGSTAAMPATLSAITTVSAIGAKTVLITNSGLNIADRVQMKGVWGLANMDTAFDALVILSLTPRATVGAKAAPTFLGRLSQNGLASLAQFQYSAAAMLGIAAPAYGAYLVYNAEAVSEQMRQDGILVSPSEVRRKGLVNIAVGLLALRENVRYFRNGIATNGEAFQEQMGSATWQGTLTRFVNQFRQIKTLQDHYAKNPGLWGGLTTAGMGLGYAAGDVLLTTEALIMAYSNLDSNFINHAEEMHPLPDLKEGETAVILVGFEPGDYLLYAGAQAPYSNRQEIRKFGSKLFMYTFESPENAMDILERHRGKHGAVRYLKISTHGRPGRLFSPAVNAAPEAALSNGWIDSQWLTWNRANLRKRSRQIFAPDTKVRLFACLVGANLDTDAGEGTDVGEKFIQRLGDTWLVNGGSIDASTRILVGLDSTAGVAVDHLFKESWRGSGERPRFALPVSPLLSDEDWQPGDDAQGEAEDSWQTKLANTIEIGKTMASRLIGIFGHWPPVWWEFGVNLEGPFWQSRYRSVDFPATAP